MAISRSYQALLAYLSQQQDMRAERGLLADLLWSDRGEEQARAQPPPRHEEVTGAVDAAAHPQAEADEAWVCYIVGIKR